MNEAGVGAARAAPTPAGVELAARTRGLHKSYGKTVAVDDVDLDIPAGSVLGMLGPNGSGKTTTIRMLLGLVRPGAGEVELLGHPMPSQAAQALPDVGALVEGPGFHPFLSGRENLLRLAAAEPRLAPADAGRAVDAALERVSLTGSANRRYRAYSLGMKQRLGLAAALLVPRRMVVLDEPTNGLDPAGTREIRKILAELHAEGVTVVVSSHLLAEVEATCTHVAILQEGNVIAQGGLADMLESGTSALLVSTPDSGSAIEALRAARTPSRLAPEGVRVDISATTAPAVIETLVRAGIPVHEATRARSGLEDLFARLTQNGTGAAGDSDSGGVS